MAWWIWVVAGLGAAAVLSLLTPKPPRGPGAAGLEDFNVPTAEDGREIPVIFGTYIIKGPNVVWYGDLKTKAIKKKSGKK